MSNLPSLRGVRALVTGHTGFKGAWLCAWLKRDGAEVAGLALEPERNGQPNLFEAADVGNEHALAHRGHPRLWAGGA